MHYQRKYRTKESGRTISFYQKGLALCGVTAPGNPSGYRGETPSKRGSIRSFSKSSSRRMREALLTHSAPDGWRVFGVCLTIPGDPPSVSDSKRLWERFKTWCKDQGMCGFWRLEIQQRGALHWHLILCVNPERYSEADRRRMRAQLREDIQGKWFALLDDMGPAYSTTSTIVWGPVLRSCLPGADARAVDVQEDSGTSKGLRYLNDHTTKAKREQIAENCGRHWGYINRPLLVRSDPLRIEALSPAAWSKFLRALQRLATPMRRCDKAPFGRKRGWRCSRGTWGRSVWFSKSETVDRLITWAREITVEA